MNCADTDCGFVPSISRLNDVHAPVCQAASDTFPSMIIFSPHGTATDDGAGEGVLVAVTDDVAVLECVGVIVGLGPAVLVLVMVGVGVLVRVTVGTTVLVKVAVAVLVLVGLLAEHAVQLLFGFCIASLTNWPDCVKLPQFEESQALSLSSDAASSLSAQDQLHQLIFWPDEFAPPIIFMNSVALG